MVFSQVRTEVLKLTLGPNSREIGDLRLEATHKGCGSVDNLFAKLKNPVWLALELGRHAGQVWIESHHQEGL
jgi:hypothetical protein